MFDAENKQDLSDDALFKQHTDSIVHYSKMDLVLWHLMSDKTFARHRYGFPKGTSMQVLFPFGQCHHKPGWKAVFSHPKYDALARRGETAVRKYYWKHVAKQTDQCASQMFEDKPPPSVDELVCAKYASRSYKH